DGWYEVVTGGYVCGKAVTPELRDPSVRLAPKQPNREAGMPYRYGVNLSDGTPLYRRVLAADDRKKYEKPPPETKTAGLEEPQKRGTESAVSAAREETSEANAKSERSGGDDEGEASERSDP